MLSTYFSKFVVKDCFVFVRKIRSISAEDTFVSSFDAKKLFSSVPLEEVIRISADMLYSLQKPSIKKENFTSLLRIATSEVELSFNEIMYSQVDGVAMGSSLSPTLANTFMGYLEYKVIPNLLNQTIYLNLPNLIYLFYFLKGGKIVTLFQQTQRFARSNTIY